MMYNSKLAVALKSAGKVLREFGETVYVPFGSEYSVLIKNLNNVRAQVTVTVDGTDAGGGSQFIVGPNDSVELERFIKNGNLKAGNRFKFIERSDSVEEHRGVGIEDGLIRVEYQFEKIQKLQLLNDYDRVCRSPQPWELPWDDRPYWATLPKTFCSNSNSSGALRSMSKGIADGNITANYAAHDGVPCSDFMTTQSMDVQNDAGITVPGSVSDQQFRTISAFPVETETHVIVLKILGETEDNARVVKPVTVKAKPKCTSCGRTNKATAKFCTECGTSLTIV